MERDQQRRRYEEYLDEQDSEKLPNAFDLGWRRNLKHLFGPTPALWFFPICNTTGDGWSWEANPRFVDTRERLRSERQEQRAREVSAGWGGTDDIPFVPEREEGAGRHFSPQPQTKSMSKADRVLGRDPNLYADATQNVPLRRLSPRGRTLDDELADLDEEDEEDDYDWDSTDDKSKVEAKRRKEAEIQAMNVVTNGGWGRGGASGMLRAAGGSQTSLSPSTRTVSPKFHDEGVDLEALFYFLVFLVSPSFRFGHEVSLQPTQASFSSRASRNLISSSLVFCLHLFFYISGSQNMSNEASS
jgi:palmitoyltransferase